MAPFLPRAASEAAASQLNHVLSLIREEGNLNPTTTSSLDQNATQVLPRQATVTVDSSGSNSSSTSGTTTLSGGAIAGIVIGSIAGFLLLLWIIRSCMNVGAPPQERESWYHYVDPDTASRRGRSKGHRRHRSSASEKVAVRRPETVYVYQDQPRRSSRRSAGGRYYG
jgi:hypothetical protein